MPNDPYPLAPSAPSAAGDPLQGLAAPDGSAPARRGPGWALLLPLAMLVWLALGPTFKTHSAHFGWGFFPHIAWHVTMPVLVLVALVFVGVETSRVVQRARKASVTRLTAWCIALVAVATVTLLR